MPCAQEGLPDNGWVLPYDDFGYYGGFTDNLEHGEKPRRAKICHDCVVKLLDALPNFAETLERGGHPCENAVPCCEFAWRTHDGETQVASPDKQWCLSPFHHRHT